MGNASLVTTINHIITYYLAYNHSVELVLPGATHIALMYAEHVHGNCTVKGPPFMWLYGAVAVLSPPALEDRCPLARVHGYAP